ncbi:Spore coat protein CotF [Halobacillus dabanensis]|uniref:Spore coat protein CotF n=1 Tax=Halobacillus dabanensis TaxID=240302 RepID=A0A1I3UC41_HALDA|nr:spore coat protein [Halobacillus dabanensis]SFJ80283.1 Spore coat protein CotF [Halobacillus dabanensis]
MKLASHELNDLAELTMGCYNTIGCMASFIQQAQDPELKQMLTRQFPLHVADYNLKVEFLQSQSTPDIDKFQPDQQVRKLSDFTSNVGTPQPGQPRTEVQTHTDREIATAYLLNQKGSAKNYAVASVECANPDLRHFLEKAFLNSNRHAYEVWQYMVQKGYYPLLPASEESLSSLSSFFQPVQQ